MVMLYKKLVLRSSTKKIKWLKLCGIKIGRGSYINCILDAFLEPYMIELSDFLDEMEVKYVLIEKENR